MIDHVLGRPSSKSRRLQVLAVISFWTFYLFKGNKHGPPGARLLSRLSAGKLTAWQTVALTMLYLYAARNFSALVGLASPEPMANMYDPTFFRATWVLTALDAGFWTAMKIRSKWLRDIAGMVFSVFYLFAAERADEKVRKVRGMITVDHLRVSWNKGTSPYLGFLQRLMRPRFTRWPPRQVRIPRPGGSDYQEPILAWLYYDGPLVHLEHHDKLILDIPGGGFVAMDPRCNDDKLFAWAATSGLPILSLDYRKAPEYPYPYALNECFDVYTTLVKTRGRCIGMSGKNIPRIIITGDSAGGNLAVATTLMILETTSLHKLRFQARGELPPPDGLVCFYPALDMNIGNWMSDDQMSLIQDRKMRKTNQSVVRRKSQQFNDLVGTPLPPSDDEPRHPHFTPSSESAVIDDNDGTVTRTRQHNPDESQASAQNAGVSAPKRSNSASYHSEPMKTRLATSSMISFTNDRVLTPEMMRAMIILYIGPHNRPDFSTDYLLSPVLAPDSLLADFPRTYFMTGERDPLVDDTVILASRLRRAKEEAARRRMGTTNGAGAPLTDEELRDLGAAEVLLIPGTSHGFLQFPALYPPAWRHFQRCAEWFEQLFAHADRARARREKSDRKRGNKWIGTVTALQQQQIPEPPSSYSQMHMQQQQSMDGDVSGHTRQASSTAESSGEEDKPLEMTMTKIRGGRGGRGSIMSNRGKRLPAEANKKSEKPREEAEEEDAYSGIKRPSTATEGPKTNGSPPSGRKGGSKGLPGSRRSLIRLDSSEDLLSRRMEGLASGLTGTGDDN